jgi:hypothetical protein
MPSIAASWIITEAIRVVNPLAITFTDDDSHGSLRRWPQTLMIFIRERKVRPLHRQVRHDFYAKAAH